jgi:hypothetical protein
MQSPFDIPTTNTFTYIYNITIENARGLEVGKLYLSPSSVITLISRKHFISLVPDLLAYKTEVAELNLVASKVLYISQACSSYW